MKYLELDKIYNRIKLIKFDDFKFNLNSYQKIYIYYLLF